MNSAKKKEIARIGPAATRLLHSRNIAKLAGGNFEKRLGADAGRWLEA